MDGLTIIWQTIPIFIGCFTCFKLSALWGNFPAAILATEQPSLYTFGVWDEFRSKETKQKTKQQQTTTNMADDRREASSLKNLLETVYEVHRKDIKTYTSGHLNSSKLLKPPDERHKRWETADKPPIRYFELFPIFRSFTAWLIFQYA